MPLPADSDYAEAIQNPEKNFADPELQAGKTEIISAALPLPKARSGNFAVAFRVDCGTRSWAVKCFTRALMPDLESRYKEISRHLSARKLPYTVGFTFLEPKGIRVRNDWFPVLKMEWINGESLAKYVERNLQNPTALSALANKWIEMIRTLNEAGVAHGDLQHGNVLVVEGDLRLIDYDGMFVPSLVGRLSHERGHENYQHPLRQADFGPSLDNFSSWVILVSILAVSHSPGLWNEFNGGDECLLFRRPDFDAPGKSRLIRALIASRHEGISSLATIFQNLISKAPDQVPTLDSYFRSSGPITPPVRPTPGWVADHLAAETRGFAGTSLRPAPTDSPLEVSPLESSWVLDFVPTASPFRARFSSDPSVERMTALLSMTALVFISWLVARGSIPLPFLVVLPVVVAGNACLWLTRYGQDPTVAERRAWIEKLEEVERTLALAEKQIRSIEQSKGRAEREVRSAKEGLQRAWGEVEKRRLSELDVPTRAYNAKRDLGSAARRKIDQRENAGNDRIRYGSGAHLLTLSQKLSAQGQAEATEIANCLTAYQTQHVTFALQQAQLEGAQIPGIKEGLKANLRARGFVCAADVDRIYSVKVPGIGDKKQAALLLWKHGVEARARARIPTQLPPSSLASIQSKYRAVRAALADELERTRLLNSRETSDLRSEAWAAHARVDVDERLAKAELDQLQAGINAAYESELAAAASNLARGEEEGKRRIDALDLQIERVRKSVLAVSWKRERLRREVATFDSVRFRNYLLRIVPGLSN